MPFRYFILGPSLALALSSLACADSSPLEIVNGVPVMQVGGQRLSPLVFSGGAFSLGRPFLASREWKKVSYSQVVPIRDPQALVQINLGGGTGHIKLRNFEFVREKDGATEVIEQQTFGGSSLPANWNFIVAPKASAQVAHSNEGISITVSRRTDFAWDVQLARGDVSLEPGSRYTISFEVSSDQEEWPLTSYLMKSEPLRFYASHDSDNQFLKTTKLAVANGVDVVALLIPQMPWTASPQEQAEEMELIHAAIADFVKNFPETRLILRFGVEPSRTWKRDHSSELLAFEDGKTSRYVCVTSTAWLSELRQRLPAFIKGMEERWGDRILGYAPAAQSTGEWYYPIWEGSGLPAMNFSIPFLRAYRSFLKERYGAIDALNSRWKTSLPDFDSIKIPTKQDRAFTELGPFRNPASQQPLLDFTEFQQVAMFDAIENVSSLIKEACGQKKLVLLFYGYTFELSGCQNGIGESGHLLLGQLLQSPHVDGIIDIISYADRGIGGTGMLMTPVESVTAHGKLLFTEDDSRTHRSAANAGYERTNNLEETKWTQTRNLLRSIIHNGVQWKFDLYGQGWFAEEKTWQALGALAAVAKSDAPSPYHSEIAVIVDEKSFLALRPGIELTRPLISENRRALSRTGMADPSWWLLDDFLAGRVPPSKLTVILNAFWLSESQRKALLEQSRRVGGTVLWLYAPGFLDASGPSLAAMTELTGFQFERVSLKGSGQSVSSVSDSVLKGIPAIDLPTFPQGVDEYFAVLAGEGIQAQALFPGSTDIAIAAKDHAGFRSVFCAAPSLTPAFLARLAASAAVHAVAPVGTTVLNNSRLLGITCTSGGTLPISLPAASDIQELGGSLQYSSTDRFDVNLQPGETKVFELRPPTTASSPEP